MGCSLPVCRKFLGRYWDANEDEYTTEAMTRLFQKIFSAGPRADALIERLVVSYDIESAGVKLAPPDGTGRIYAVSEIYRKSDELCDQVALVASRLGSSFLDLRPYARLQAKGNPLHGPKDWNHFNRLGYEALGKAVAERLRQTNGLRPSCQNIDS